MTLRERSFLWRDPSEFVRHAVNMDGLAWLQAMKNGDLPPPPIVVALGMQPEELELGRVVFSMLAQEWMCNPLGVVHGGMAATLLDTVLTLAVVTKLGPGRVCQTIQLNVNYVRPLFPTGERIRAEGVTLHLGTTLATSEGRLHCQRGKLLAHATATLAVLDGDALATRFPAAP